MRVDEEVPDHDAECDCVLCQPGDNIDVMVNIIANHLLAMADDDLDKIGPLLQEFGYLLMSEIIRVSEGCDGDWLN